MDGVLRGNICIDGSTLCQLAPSAAETVHGRSANALLAFRPRQPVPTLVGHAATASATRPTVDSVDSAATATTNIVVPSMTEYH